MKYTKKVLIKMLESINVPATTNQSIMELMLIAKENGLDWKREDVVIPEPNEKRPRGRPIQFSPKVIVKLTNVETGEETTYNSKYQAIKALGCNIKKRNNGQVVNGMRYEVMFL